MTSKAGAKECGASLRTTTGTHDCARALSNMPAGSPGTPALLTRSASIARSPLTNGELLHEGRLTDARPLESPLDTGSPHRHWPLHRRTAALPEAPGPRRGVRLLSTRAGETL